ncbi:MAG: 1-(5-phosphoribosyl)-5-[(5-phosphoribosylamino)methylideneamino]imidazole-4-carboxamide isomerase [Bacteroides sp.]|nr:1-(5-phosphoribosyl)-5-[(5-phosphoribosylamino)methylideneamino]imidazole-4-carboxamide isomerase [Bacteroides sp.]MCM1389464.1 1-(5-phosphoribosyl)-5-[(5-phosphoribosylamino)methylideneamino]imidazole-4-carboxamide isomerase [Bacteroides sp.]
MTEIIPAIDIIGGRCVRLTKGDYGTAKVYDGNPVDIAKAYEDAGCRKLHVVDLDGAKSQHIVNHRTLDKIASGTNLTIDFGGGIKHEEDIKMALDYGASKVTLGSIAVRNPDLSLAWLNQYGCDKIIIGADTRNGKISTSGWLQDSDMEIMDFLASYIGNGATQVISTDINVDGTLNGPSVGLYRDILNHFPELYLIASGGVGGMVDVHSLNEADVPAVIVGKALYEGKITTKELEKYNLQK